MQKMFRVNVRPARKTGAKRPARKDRRRKTARFFFVWGGKSPPERLFRLWAQYAATPSLYDQTQDLPGFLACGWGDNAPQQKN